MSDRLRVRAYGDNTFPNRDRLKALGLTWDPRSRTWTGTLSTAAVDAFKALCAEQKINHQVGDGPRHTYLPPGSGRSRHVFLPGVVAGEGRLDLEGLDGPKRSGRRGAAQTGRPSKRK
jgi:hypothetical protein